MSLKTDIRNAVSNVIENLVNEGLAKRVTYNQPSAVSYNSETGAVTTTNITKANVAGVFAKFDSRKIDGEFIRPHDEKFITTVKALGGVVPTVSDTILLGTVDYDIVRIMTPPSDEVHILHVRKRG